MSTTINDRTVSKICHEMRAHGFCMYREHFMWGQTPAFRNEEKTQYYFVDTHVVDDKIHFMVVTPLGLLKHLLDTWRPVARAEVDYAAGRMRSDLEAMPHTPEWPHGELKINGPVVIVDTTTAHSGDTVAKPKVKKQKPQFSASEIQDGTTGICLACQETQEGCEPDMRAGKCETCGERRVFGLEEALFMGEIELDMEGDE